MDQLNEKFRNLGVMPSDILLPKKDIDLTKWSVIACDQYTSESDYWYEVEDYIGNKPSTYNLIFPECFLNDDDKEKRIERINKKMNEYINSDIFDEYKDCFILTKRTTDGKSRLGLMVSLDLENYSIEKDSKSLIRATEGTILSRIPPRKEIRKNASLELPHIMVLISDENRCLIEKLYSKCSEFKKIYDFDFMKEGGHVEGWLIDSTSDKTEIEEIFEQLYSKLDSDNRLLFAMGDGNHSFATAKSCWDDLKKNLTVEEQKNHPARFCLVELENIFDEGLVFEPIHRVLFNVSEDDFLNELNKHGSDISFETVMCKNCIAKRLNDQSTQGFGYCTSDKHVYVRIGNPESSISAGTIQKVIDSFIDKGINVDYIHGNDITDKLGSEKGNIGIFLPAIDKRTFFDSIIKDGALPRKTFSIGEANEKRFYLEAKRIK